MTKLNVYEQKNTSTTVPLSAKETPTLWRSLAHREGELSSEGQEHEFPNGIAPEEFSEAALNDPALGLKRRSMLKAMGASVAFAGVGVACRRPEDLILPYVKQPEEVIPGVANHYATSFPGPHGAVGLVVESHEGRPTKIEGNPDHPLSNGKAGVTEQASILDIYDPDRSQTPLKAGSASDWATFDAEFSAALKKFEGTQGAGLAILSDGQESPTLGRLQALAKAKFPKATFAHHAAMEASNTIAGSEMVFGGGSRVHYDLSQAKVILALDSNFLEEGPEALKMARGYAAGRGFDSLPDARSVNQMNRLYAVESTYSTTGTNADHRLPLDSSKAGSFLKQLATKLMSGGARLPEAFGGEAATASLQGSLSDSTALPDGKFLDVLAKDLGANAGKAIVLVGDRQPAAVHALAHLVNAALGAFNQVAQLSQPAASQNSNAPVSSEVAASDSEGTAENGAAAENSAQAVANVQRALHTSANSSLSALAKALNGNKVDTLIEIGVNPDFTSPGALGFAEARQKAKTLIHLGYYADESAQGAAWHAPLSHYLESWGDLTAWDGTVSLVQPLIAPLFPSRSLTEIWGTIAGESKKQYDALRFTWMNDQKVIGSELAWRKALHKGLIPAGARSIVPAANVGASVASAVKAIQGLKPGAEGTELILSFDHKVGDGGRANNSWLQELPHSVTKLCWDNALLVGPALAKKLGLVGKVIKNKYMGDVVTVAAGSAQISIPAFVVPGMAPNTAEVNLGYGRRNAGFIGNGVGVDAYGLVPADGSRIVAGVTLTRTGEMKDLCSTQDHFSLDWQGEGIQDMEEMNKDFQTKRPIAVTVNAKDYEANPAVVSKGSLRSISKDVLVVKDFKKKNPQKPDRPIQLINEVFPYEGQQWGLVFDMSSCTGCNACVIACQAENNIPIVGREEVLKGREMHWVRIDRYFSGSVNNPTAIHQPVICLHCENAPCEPVCPVAATVHDSEGTNGMIYNRCIGTRYCANNCPVKVRRFNYFDFTHTAHLYVADPHEKRHETLKMQRNPDVSVRFRGVMEKCSFCTQRIQEAKFAAKRKGEDSKNLKDGSIVPACQQTCPTEAITFGNINDPTSQVAKRKMSDRNFEMLSELNIRPRTTYLAKLRNPHPELG